MNLQYFQSIFLLVVLVLLTAPDESSSTFLSRDGPLSGILRFKKRLLLMAIPMKIALLETIFGHGRRRGDKRQDDDDDFLGDLGLDQLFARPLKRDKKHRMVTTSKRPRTRPTKPTPSHTLDDLYLDEHEEALAKESKLKPRSATGIKTHNQLFKIIKFLTSDGVLTGHDEDDTEQDYGDFDWNGDEVEPRGVADTTVGPSTTTSTTVTPTRGHDELVAIKKKLLSSIESKISHAGTLLANSLTENERRLIKLLPIDIRIKLVENLAEVGGTAISKGSEGIVESSIVTTTPPSDEA